MARMTTIEQAIYDSIHENRTVTLEHSHLTEEEVTSLELACEDDVRNGQAHEFWGTNDDGDWRVHVLSIPEDGI